MMETEAIVRARLAEAGLNLDDEKVAAFVKVYPTLRASADRLFIPEVRYEEPAVVFRVLS
jgi:hypothetical protein